MMGEFFRKQMIDGKHMQIRNIPVEVFGNQYPEKESWRIFGLLREINKKRITLYQVDRLIYGFIM